MASTTVTASSGPSSARAPSESSAAVGGPLGAPPAPAALGGILTSERPTAFTWIRGGARLQRARSLATRMSSNSAVFFNSAAGRNICFKGAR
eukprot:8259538-Pyramimonas_sp.AAC.1